MTADAAAGPLVSILINSYNYARYLPIAIDSALAQTYPSVEVIVVDDGSTDGSEAVLKDYDGRVRVVRQANAGQPAACYTGFQASSGDIVMFLDADDFLVPDAASKVVQAWQDGCAKVQFRLTLVDSDGNAFGTDPPWTAAMPNGDVTEQLRTTGWYVTPVTTGNAFPRALLSHILPFPPQYDGPDHYLNPVAPLFGPVVSIDEELGAYRQHASNRWAFSAGVDVERLRERVRFDLIKEAQLRQTGAERGIEIAPDLALRSSDHLLHRLASLRLEPATHPQRGDRRFALLRKGFSATWRTPEMSAVDRLVRLAVLLAVAVLPRRGAAAVVTWAVGGGRRPEWMRWIARLLRGELSRKGRPTPGEPAGESRDSNGRPKSTMKGNP